MSLTVADIRSEIERTIWYPYLTEDSQREAIRQAVIMTQTMKPKADEWLAWMEFWRMIALREAEAVAAIAEAERVTGCDCRKCRGL